MTLVRRSIWDPFTSLVRQMDREFDSLVRRAFGPGAGTEVTGFVPAANIAREGSDVVITLELPGIDVERDVDVEVAGGRLVISGRRTEEHEDTEGGLVVRELRSGEFRREFALPEDVSADRVEADYDRGLLRVRVRDIARPAVSPAKIKIRGAGRAEKPAVEGAPAEEKDTHAEEKDTPGDTAR
ncbi:hypothetical protein GCM10012275_53480 [Longimycelium tulufanense]|uniref:SHSP domain-containing protein n=1 Tax=Longimycelium tulufanense TaxID=907463 RepID=A0A8J3FXQ6_9PSEU|nr:Hsp20/alpha crystallin family protein [Longimycelium tulufanense]GGM76080.1 hypothetical protein GCM10012275_53480 [Longimycelium tulufanense]